MDQSTSPFRADHVGSYLRPPALKDARAQHEKREITDAQLKDVEDREIERLVRRQEEVGLKLATDGEFRRAFWHFDFWGMLEGVSVDHGNTAIRFQGVQSKPHSLRISGKIDFPRHHPM